MNKKCNETALLIGWAGNIFPAVKVLLEEKGMDVIHINGDALNHLDTLHAAPFQDGRMIRYAVYSALLDRGMFPSRITDMSVEDWKAWKQRVYQRLFDVNRYLVRKMLGMWGSRFLIVGSISGVIPSNGEEVSGAASASAFMIMKSMATELAASGLTASAIALGVLQEDAGVVTLGNTEAVRRHIPAGRPISVREAAQGIVRQLMENDCLCNGNVSLMDSGFACSYMRDW
ncbi:MAG: SDR family oxidoreductase [Clostridia bacterium]|nr:SDR family oxidoreductase [Clostridia bacterium]